MPTQAPCDARSNVFFMILTAALFGYLGFGFVWNHTGTNGEFLLFVALLEWTLKITAIAFGIAAGLTLINNTLGNLVYVLFGLASAVLLAVVAVMDILDPLHTALHPVLLILFALWNGYGSWIGLRELVMTRPTPQ